MDNPFVLSNHFTFYKNINKNIGLTKKFIWVPSYRKTQMNFLAIPIFFSFQKKSEILKKSVLIYESCFYSLSLFLSLSI